MRLLGEFVMGAGLLVMLCGFIGLVRYRSFYRRLLVSALIDTVGLLLLLAGVVLRQGWNSFSHKVLLILLVVLLTAPLIAHKLGRSAYLSGHREGEK